MIPSNSDELLQDFPDDPGFREAAEALGGVLDLRSPAQDPRLGAAMPEGRDLTRALFLPPLNVFRSYLATIEVRGPLAASICRDVHFGILYSAQPNAVAWQRDGHHFLGVTAGLGYLLFGWAAQLLSFPTFLPDFVHGAEEEEQGDVEELRRGFDLSGIADWRISEGKMYAKHRLPHSAARLVISYQVAHLAMIFALFHELGHVVLGHVNFAGDHLDLAGLDELGIAFPQPSDDLQLAHLFEFMADNFAIQTSLSTRLPEKYVGDAADGYATWSLATDLLLWLFSYRYTLGPPSGSHPHPQVRLFNKINKLIEFEEKYPAYIVCSITPEKQVGIDRFSGWVSRQLADAWVTLGLPGGENRAVFDEAARTEALDAYRAIVREKSPIAQRYEASIEWPVVDAFTRLGERVADDHG